MAVARSNEQVEIAKIKIKIGLINNPNTPDALRENLLNEIKNNPLVTFDMNESLLIGASWSNLGMIKFAVKGDGANIHHVNADNINAVWQVVYYAKKEKLAAAVNTLRYLLENKVDPNIIPTKENCKLSPLSLAAYHGYEEMVELLLKHNANPNLKNTEDSTTPLYFAAQNSFCAIATHLIKAGANVNSRAKENATPLHFAVKSGTPAMIGLLIENGADVNARNDLNESVAMIAAGRTKNPTEWDSVSLLIWKKLFAADPKIDLNVVSKTTMCALQAATETNNQVLANLLLTNGARANIRVGLTATSTCSILHHAIKHSCSLAIIESLIVRGANLNEIDGDEMTPLAMAVYIENEKIVTFLIKKGAKVNVKDGVPPLHAAVNRKKLNLVNLLLSQPGIVVDKVYKTRSALQWAIEDGSAPIAQALIAKGALDKEDAWEPAIATALRIYCADPAVVAQMGTMSFMSKAEGNKALDNMMLNKSFIEFHKGPVAGNSAVMNLLIKKKFGERYVLSKVEKIITLNDPADCLYMFKLYDTFTKEVVNPTSLSASQSESSRSFLIGKGYTPEEIEQLKKRAAKDEPASSSTAHSIVKDNSKITWLDGQLSISNTPKIKQIINADNENCFSLIVEKNLPKKLSEDELCKFKAVSSRFAAERNSQGLKPLKGTGEVWVTLNGEDKKVSLSHEIKIAGDTHKSRILCFPVLSDDKRHTLYLGAIYSQDGLHKKNLGFFTDKNRKIEINLLPVTKADAKKSMVKGMS